MQAVCALQGGDRDQEAPFETPASLGWSSGPGVTAMWCRDSPRWRAKGHTGTGTWAEARAPRVRPGSLFAMDAKGAYEM